MLRNSVFGRFKANLYSAKVGEGTTPEDDLRERTNKTASSDANIHQVHNMILDDRRLMVFEVPQNTRYGIFYMKN